MKSRVIILEFDGATWDIIDPMISRGELPNFKALKDRSVFGEVNTDYYGSPEIWTAIFTGKSKEKYGSPFFGVNRSRLKAKRIWEIAAEKGLRIGVLHSLLSWPPAEVDGFIIPDVFAMGPETYPRRYEHFQKLYLSRHGKNIARQGYYLLRSFFTCGSLDALFALVQLATAFLIRREYLNIFRRSLMVVTKLDHNLLFKLYRKYRPQLCTFHLHALDTVSHKYWIYKGKPGRYGRVIADFYRQADRLLGQVFELLGNGDSLVVLADHGFTEFTEGRSKFEINPPAFRQLFHVHSAARVVRIGDAFIINLGGAAGEMDADGLTAELTSAQLEDGTPLFINVKRIDENIHFRLPKPNLENRSLSDEMITFGKLGQVAFRDLFRKMAFEDTGIHAAGRGIFAVCGRNFLKKRDIEKVGIFDIAPTLLTLLDLPIAKDMDGDFDKRWFTKEALKATKLRYISSYETERKKGEQISTEAYTEREVQDLEERLKMLGYL